MLDRHQSTSCLFIPICLCACVATCAHHSTVYFSRVLKRTGIRCTQVVCCYRQARIAPNHKKKFSIKSWFCIWTDCYTCSIYRLFFCLPGLWLWRTVENDWRGLLVVSTEIECVQKQSRNRNNKEKRKKKRSWIRPIAWLAADAIIHWNRIECWNVNK